MSEENIALPKTSEISDKPVIKLPPAGLSLFSVSAINHWRDGNGNLKKDTRGYPGVYVSFTTDNNETISSGFYYSDKPLDHPSRADKSLKCKSEYYLSKLRRAFGLSGSDDFTVEALSGKKIWIPIALKKMVGRDKKPILNKEGKEVEYKEIVKDFLAYFKDQPAPVLAGDPLNSKATEPGGIFLIIKEDNRATSSAPASASSQYKEAPATKTARVEAETVDDMPVDENEEEPDF